MRLPHHITLPRIIQLTHSPSKYSLYCLCYFIHELTCCPASKATIAPMTDAALAFFLLNYQTTTMDVQFNINDNTSISDNPSCPDHTPHHKIASQPSRPMQRDEPSDFKCSPEIVPPPFHQGPSRPPEALYKHRAARQLQRQGARSTRDKGRRTACRGAQWENSAPLH